MRILNATSLCLLAALVLSSCTKPGPNPTATSATPSTKRIASVDVVKAVTQPTDVMAGSSAESSVVINIQSGFHVNANPPTFPYLKATELRIPASNGVSLVSVKYPEPQTKTFSFADQPLAVYEGEAVIRAVLKADASAQKGTQALRAQVQVQACDDQVCYAPGLLELTIPVNIK